MKNIKLKISGYVAFSESVHFETDYEVEVEHILGNLEDNSTSYARKWLESDILSNIMDDRYNINKHLYQNNIVPNGAEIIETNLNSILNYDEVTSKLINAGYIEIKEDFGVFVFNYRRFSVFIKKEKGYNLVNTDTNEIEKVFSSISEVFNYLSNIF